MLTRREPNRGGFSLVELLVVIGIIVVLVAILLPVASRIRAASRSTKCLPNLQQWGYSYQMYVNSSRLSSMTQRPADPNGVRWWEVLAPYNANLRQTLVCPDASEPAPPSRIASPPPGAKRFVTVGGVKYAWRAGSEISSGVGGQPEHVELLGSYGFNIWVHNHPDVKGAKPNMGHIHYPTMQSSQIPLLGDNRGAWSLATTTDTVPSSVRETNVPFFGMGGFCIDRHRMSINVVFLDGHAENVGLASLWQLHWSEGSMPRNVTVPEN